MSGVEFSFLVGVVSGTITIVDSIIKICKHARQGGLPQAFRNTNQKLPLIREILKAVEERLSNGDFGGDRPGSAIAVIIHDCNAKVKSLEVACKKSIPHSAASKIDRLLKSARAQGQATQVASLMKMLLENVQIIAQRLSIESPTHKHVEEVTAIVKSLSLSPQPRPECHTVFDEESCRIPVIHYGQGYQNISGKFGDQNIVIGSGSQHISDSQIIFR